MIQRKTGSIILPYAPKHTEGAISLYYIYAKLELLFYTNKPGEQKWEGRTFTGDVVKAGVYFYFLKNISDNSVYKGYIQLVR